MVYLLYKCIIGPTLIRLYRTSQSLGRNYATNSTEYYSNSIIDIFHGIYLFCKWTSPALLAFAYYKGYFTIGYLFTFSKLVAIFGGIVIAAHIVRGIGRYRNIDYNKFMTEYAHLTKSNVKYSSDHRLFLTKYDFTFDSWIEEFKPKSQPPLFKNEDPPKAKNIFESIKHVFMRLASALCVDTFGLRMMYPGIILQNLLKKPLIEGRAKIIENKGAIRSMIKTFDDKNSIDTVFIDRRNTPFKNGQTLIICCDGNAAFYEIGIFMSSVEKGYSTLGWNYPGFGASIGLPYPEDVTSSADAVLQYALKLGFEPQNIILFSWSIGGFPASWLAMNYPDIKGVILDACFDNIVHLARQQLPAFATDIVEFGIRTRLNLNVLEIINNYLGPIRLIRRTNDEIISTIQSIAATNRGNDLLIGIMKKRYPHIMNDETITLIRLWLKENDEASRIRLYDKHVAQYVNEIELIIKSYLEENEFRLTYPIELGKSDITNDMKLSIGLYLANRYLLNHESTHCTQLPLHLLREPWRETELLNNTNNNNNSFTSNKNNNSNYDDVFYMPKN